jgi:ADP-ribose pyrophosphatase
MDHEQRDDARAQHDEELAWETVDSAIDYSCPGFDVRRDEVVLPDGTETSFHYVEEPPGVVVLPFTPDGEVVVIEEWRQPVRRVNRSLPAGTADDGDTDLAATARRELREETGYRADDVERVLSVEPSNGLIDSVRHVFRAHGCEPAGEQRLDHNESIRVRTVAYDELLAAAVDDQLRDERAVTALLHHELTERGPIVDPEP